MQTPGVDIPDLVTALESLLRQIPRGRVTTYGDLAGALGARSAARWVGEHLVDHQHSRNCPCHRVVRSDGSIGLFISSDPADKVRKLEREAVPVVDGRVDLGCYRFDEFCSDQPLARLLEFQTALPERVVEAPYPQTPEFIAGVDVSYVSPREAVGGYAMVDSSTGELVWSTTVEFPVGFPYIPGLLAFREIPVLLKLMERAVAEKKLADVVFVDGNGILHNRFAGIATHLGVAGGVRTIGVGKKLLCGSVDLEDLSAGEQRPVVFKERLVGMAVKAKDGSRPIFVSPGHDIDVADATRLAQELFRDHRLPEPLYWADALSRKSAQSLQSTRGDK